VQVDVATTGPVPGFASVVVVQTVLRGTVGNRSAGAHFENVGREGQPEGLVTAPAGSGTEVAQAQNFLVGIHEGVGGEASIGVAV